MSENKCKLRIPSSSNVPKVGRRKRKIFAGGLMPDY